MLDTLMSYLAPHHCCGCDKIGSLLCDNCKYDIVSEPNTACLVCMRLAGGSGPCKSCSVPYSQAWMVGKRQGELQMLIGLYKFERAKEAYKPLAHLLNETLPVLPDNTVIIPIPTTPSRSRERGYDHMLLVAKRLAKLRNLKYQQLLMRKSNTKQRQAGAEKREQQARQAFMVSGKLDPTIPYLVIDDVMTTGATMKYATLALKNAGAKTVWVAVIARQTLT